MRVWRGCYIWLRASLQPVTALGLILIAACWIAVTFVMSIERGKTLEGAIQQSEILARLFEENTVQTLLGIDRTLLLLRRGFESDPEHFDLRNWAERTAVSGDLVVQISIVGPDGFVTATTTGYSGPPLHIGDRQHFLAQVDADADKLFISEPVLGRASGKRSIQLSRRIARPNGIFGGIIVASLDPNFIQTFYGSVDLGSHGSVILLNLDGVILTSRGAAGNFTGRQVLQPAIRDALARASAGYYWDSGELDDVTRLVGFRVSKIFPIIATVGRAESDVFEIYRRHRDTYLSVVAIVTILVLIVVAGGTHYKLRLDRIRDNLRLSEAQAHERAHSLELKSRELEVTLDHMGQGIVMTDANNNVLVTNRQAMTLLGLPESFCTDHPTTDELLPHLLNLDADGLGVEPPDSGTHDPLKSGAMSTDIQVYQRTRPNGAVLEIHSAPLQEGGTVRTITDITERKRAELEIVRIAHHDTLTDLPNRVLLHDRIDQAFGGARRDEGSFAILCVDLDRFKIANDTLGHQAGDALLRQVADRLRGCARDVDTVARVGGDEFVVLQATVVMPEDVTPLANRILRAVSAPYDINGSQVVISASIGIAVAPADGASADELLGHADLALYRAKSDGRNSFCFFDLEMSRNATERVRFELELRQALSAGKFEVHYQPIVSIETRRKVGMEALARWRHPLHGLISPDKFIPLAEKTGLINPLGELVLRQACMDAVKWPPFATVAVNLSPVQFQNPDLARDVARILAESKLPPERLELEITESVLLQRSEKNISTLHELSSLGVSIALDDFGTGHSSLSYLRMFPFDKIKIDRSFVSEMSQVETCAAIVCAVANLGRSLNIVTTAEGVETEEQLELLRAAGCIQAQGYLFGRPCPVANLDFGNEVDRAAAKKNAALTARGRSTRSPARAL